VPALLPSGEYYLHLYDIERSSTNLELLAK
jgi:hypothetical protein